MPKGLGRPFNKKMRFLSSEANELAKDVGKDDPLVKRVKKDIIAASDQGLERRKFGATTDKMKALLLNKGREYAKGGKVR